MRRIYYLVLHHSGVNGPNQAPGIIANHKKRGLFAKIVGMAYHWLIEEDSSEVKGRPWWTIGYHAGDYYVNLNSMAICLAGDFTTKEPSKKQLNVLGTKIIDICTTHRIPLERVLLHWDVKSTSCPGIDYKWLLKKYGILERERRRRINILNKSLSRANALRKIVIKRKIAFLETKFSP